MLNIILITETNFEIAICRTLRQILPLKFGICRGFAINAEGKTAGDDILIYDRMRFPTVRSLDQDDFAKKERVPIEAILAYIEAKHTFQLDGDGPSTLEHASEQATRVKNLCNERCRVPPSQITSTVDVQGFMPLKSPDGFPRFRNPMFSMIFARQIRLEKNGEIVTKSSKIHDGLIGRGIGSIPRPDLVVAGANNIILPSVKRDGKTHILSPFYLEDEGILLAKTVDGLAFGIAIINLLAALDFIELGNLPWSQLLAESIGAPFLPKTP